ncbi:hypothetical protein KPSA1_01508 [Pseudomonas syringae pv. actinidiae]|uniref:Uncharacterized protein n=1 Tax=Pseudomonas syringae pv. actinidiae TaxID=103796 RepID=A0A2V0R1Z6_PSESF|nr:hypothetical protein KPSA1_01508 [Pseudomonas syringae pv. actinidiae]GBH15542.1 hypothetical protein KPSA3_01470 [Pseudomonas syringae pv. actinidiae]
MTLYRVQNPGARLPWRLMAQVLSVAARKQHKPVCFFILAEADNR